MRGFYFPNILPLSSFRNHEISAERPSDITTATNTPYLHNFGIRTSRSMKKVKALFLII